MKTHIWASAIATACAVSLGSASVNAQSRETPASNFTAGPNRGLLGTGLVMFGLPYAASVAVAATSERPADRDLFIPVAGPWMDISNRRTCAGTTFDCDQESFYKAILAANGVLQAVGALAIVGSVLFPEVRPKSPPPANSLTPARDKAVMISPYYTGNGSYGLSAIGRF
jgi:hypothetical protein